MVGENSRRGDALRRKMEEPSSLRAEASPGEREEVSPLAAKLLDMSGVEAFAFDRDGRLAYLNARAGGIAWREGLRLGDVFPEDVVNARMAAAADVLSSGRGGLLEINARLGERRIWFHDRFEMLKAEAPGEALLMVASCDVSFWRLMERERPAATPVSSSTPGLVVLGSGWLEAPFLPGSAKGALPDYAADLKAREFERDAISDGLDGVIVERLGKSLQVLWGNKRICDICGLSVDELKGRICHEAIRREAKPCDGCTAVDALKTGSPRSGEIKSPDGRCYKSKSSPVFDENGQVEGVLHVAMDITEWRSLEARMLEAKAKAEELSRVKSEFLSCISHEIRTPLNAIVGMAELLKDSSQGGGQEVSAYCGEIVRASDMLLSILNDILDYSLLESGEVKVFSQDFDIREEVNSVAEAYARRAGEKGLEFAVEVHPEFPWAVCGDPRHLRRILQNLLDNAVKFTESGRVCLKTERPRPRGRDGVLLRFEISDTGVGIAEDARDRIFDAFTQEDSSSKRTHGGTGLGLAIVRKFVEALGGRVDMRSVKGVGSVFCVELPFAKPKAQKPAGALGEETAPRPSFAGVKALLVDPSSSAALVKRILETLDIKVLHLSSLEGLEKGLADGVFDMAFFHSESSSLERLKAKAANLKSVLKSERIPLVAMAQSASGRGAADASERELCEKAGIAALLSKPPRRSQMAAVLRSYFPR